MYWIVTGLVLFGAVCGATIRLMPFALILVLAAILAAIGGGRSGAGGALLSAMIAVVVLQVGYVGGIMFRAALRSWLTRSTDSAEQSDGHGSRLPDQRKHR